MNFDPDYEEMNPDFCDCGACRYCRALNSSEYDYQTEEYECSRCNGAGCTKCEE